jgi:hypothetical protein
MWHAGVALLRALAGKTGLTSTRMGRPATLRSSGRPLTGCWGLGGSRHYLAGVRQKCRAIAFPLVVALFWLYAFQPGGNMQVRGMQAELPPLGARLKCAVTTQGDGKVVM